MNELDNQVQQEEAPAIVDSSKKDEKNQEQSLSSFEQGNSSPEIEKMKAVIRQLFRDREKLKKDIEIECKEHDADVSRMSEEANMIKLEIKRLNEEKNLSQLPSPEEDAKIRSLTKQLSDLKASLKSVRLSATELNQANAVIQKEVEQYKMSISTLEEDLLSSEESKAQCVNLQSKLSSLEEEKREKQRMIDELVVSERLSSYELQKIKNKINLIKTGKPIILDIEKQDPIFIHQPVSRVPSAALEAYKNLNRFNVNDNLLSSSPSNLIEKNFEHEKEEEKKINNFILTFPRQIQILEEENERINEQCKEVQKKCQKLLSMSKSDSNTNKPDNSSINNINSSNSNEESIKMAEIVKNLSSSNHTKSLKLKELKAIADQQHASLQRLVGIPKANESIIQSLRQILDQLEKCDQADSKNLCEIGEKMLDAMVGIGSDVK